MKKIIIIQRRLPHYRIPFFIRLNYELASRGIKLSLAHGEPTSEEMKKNDGGYLPWAVKLSTGYWLRGRLCWLKQRAVLQDADLVVLTPENKMLSNLPVQYFARNYRVALWGHGANLQGNPNSWRERFKRVVARQADWWFGYTEMSRPLIERTGFPPDRITILQNAVDTTGLRQLMQEVSEVQKTQLRARFGLQGEKIGIYIGSLYAEKRIDFMLNAAKQIRQRVPDFEFLIVGSGPDLPLVERFCSDHPWAHYAGVLKGADKAQALSLARVMLNPGLVGLGILDSFVAGVPLVTTDCGLHSPEIAYLESGHNGLMCEDTEDAFVQTVCNVLVDDVHWKTLRAGCELSASKYTVENMARNFADGIERCLATARLR